MTTKTIDKNNYFDNLDGLRFIAFFLVFVAHFYFPAFELLNVQEGVFKSMIEQYIGNGTAGVHVFFVLSGFLITYLLLVEKKKTDKINVGYFYIRRALRIWPLYYAVVLFALIVYPVLKTYVGADGPVYYRGWYYLAFLGNFDVIHIQRFYEGIIPGFLEITWSVAIEEQFYLVWPLLFLIVPQRRYVYIFLVTILISFAFNMYSLMNGWTYNGRHTLSVMYFLSIGGLAAYYVVHSALFVEYFKSMTKRSILGVYVSGLSIFTLKGLILPYSGFAYFVSGILMAFFFAFIILEQNFSKNSFYKFSSNRFITRWGKYTYGLYMLHDIAGLLVMGIYKILKLETDTFILSMLNGTVVLILAFALSYFSFHLFEKKFLDLKKKFSIVS